MSGLASQVAGFQAEGDAVALLTIGGNDLLQGLVVDDGPGIEAFGRALDAVLAGLPIRRVLVGNVYDPAYTMICKLPKRVLRQLAGAR